MRCSAIVVAAGSGQRFGGFKQFADLGGTSVAARSITGCRAVAGEVVLVVPPGHEHDDHGADRVVVGGATRSASVRAGLEAIDDEAHVVVIHDAARPLASPELFDSVVAALLDDEIDGAITAIPIADTVKEVVSASGRTWVTATLDRSALVSVQTPQAFRVASLRKAHGHDGNATDDAALVEARGGRVVVVPGSPDNFKLTSARDLEAAIYALGGVR